MVDQSRVIVSMRAVNQSYRLGNNESTVALSDVNLDVREREFVTMIGPSGCGKTTTLNIVAGLLQPTSGEVLVGGHPPTKAREAHELGVVFQDPVLLPWKTVRQNTEFLLEVTGQLDDSRRAEARDLVEMVGLKDFHNHYPHQLLGGMKQRVAIARALSLRPLLLLMDEPFGRLDEFTRYRMNVELLEVWSTTRQTVLFITHNIAEAVFMSDRVVAMSPRPGRIVEDITIDLPRPRAKEVRYTPEFNEHVVYLQRLLETEEPGPE